LPSCIGALSPEAPQNWTGDKGYVGNGMITPRRKQPGRDLLAWEKTFNAAINRRPPDPRRSHLLDGVAAGDVSQCPTTGDRRSPLVNSMCHVLEPDKPSPARIAPCSVGGQSLNDRLASPLERVCSITGRGLDADE